MSFSEHKNLFLHQKWKNIFTERWQIKSYPHDIILIEKLIEKSSNQKYFQMFFKSKLGFEEHYKGIFDKTSKSIGLICNIQNFITEIIPSTNF